MTNPRIEEAPCRDGPSQLSWMARLRPLASRPRGAVGSVPLTGRTSPRAWPTRDTPATENALRELAVVPPLEPAMTRRPLG